VAIFILTALLCTPALADEHTYHAHDPLDVDPALTLDGAVEAALAAYPARPVLDARREQAEAWDRRGASLIKDRPSMMLRYQSDRWGSDAGLDEYEAGIELPLWSWGGRSATQAFADAITSESQAARAALHWEVAGLVRQSLWNVALAENAHELAEQSLDTAARLVETVERRYELGDVAQRDVLLARSTYLDYETALIEASAALLDAERTYRTVTQLDRRPAFVAETLSDIGNVTDAHPALALADLAVERAEADVEVARQSSNAGATVLVGTRRERPAFGTSFDDSIGVTLNVPFGGSAHRDTQIAAAARAASEARAARNQEFRMLELEMHEAAHSLAVVRENYAAASQRLEIAERHQEMGEMAYEKGEIELLDLLKIKDTAIAARRHVMRLQIDEKRQTALYNQAVGELP
jgi:outer membrane protein TolC